MVRTISDKASPVLTVAGCYFCHLKPVSRVFRLSRC